MAQKVKQTFVTRGRDVEEDESDQLDSITYSNSAMSTKNINSAIENTSIVDEVDTTFNLLESVDNSIYNLCDRLEPILPNRDFSDLSPVKGEDSSNLSQLARQLREVNNKLRSIRHSLDVLRDTVQL